MSIASNALKLAVAVLRNVVKWQLNFLYSICSVCTGSSPEGLSKNKNPQAKTCRFLCLYEESPA